MINKIINKFILIPIIKMKYKKKRVIFRRKSSVDSFSSFGGANIVGPYSSVVNSIIGFGSYISNNTLISNTIVKNYTSIGPNVGIIFGQHPTHTFVSTHPAFYSLGDGRELTYTDKQLFNEYRYVDKNKKVSVVIGNDVWIGESVKIMEGVTIGDGAIIAAGALVTKNIPDYAIVGGVPAKIIRYRFSKEEVKFLLELEWWNRSEEWVKIHSRAFCDIKSFKDNIFEKY